MLVLAGTIGSTSVTAPNNTVSYAAFTLLLLAAGAGMVRRRWAGTITIVSIRLYDMVPLALILIWLYGLVLGFANHNRTSSVIRNFAGMTLYSLYYVFLFTRIRKFDLVRCVLIAAAVNAAYMFGFFLFDKGYGRVVSVPTYFRFFEVRDYYSETLVLLLAPAALIVRQLLSPPSDVPPRTIRARDAVAIVLLYTYLFAFLQISLSKATLLAYLVAIPVTILFLSRRLLDLVRRGAFVRPAAVAGTGLLCLYPLTHLLAYMASADSVSPQEAMAAPELGLPPPRRDTLPVFQAAEASAVDDIVHRFAVAAAARIGTRGRVLVPREYAPMFKKGLGARVIYRASASTRASRAWDKLEHGTPADMAASLRTLGIRHLLVQTAQPRSRVLSTCVQGPPVARSDLLRTDATSAYAFELYAIDTCRTLPVPAINALSAPMREFVNIVGARVEGTGRVWIRQEQAAIFAGQVPNLVYPRAPGVEGIPAEDWTRLEAGSLREIHEAISRLGISYAIVQTAQPRPRMLDACVFGAPIARSAVLVVDARSRYAFELYAVNGCRAPLVLPPPAPSLVQSRIARREMNRVLIDDLRPLGRGLGASVKHNQRDPGGYGFEQNYLNLMHKFGVFALVIFVVYAATLLKIALASHGFRTRHFAFASTAFLAGLIMGFGNPILMSPIIVTLHCMVLYWLRPGERAKATRWVVRL